MAQEFITSQLRKLLADYIQQHPNEGLVNTYLYFVEHKHKMHPVLVSKDKVIYESADKALEKMKQAGKLWKETEIKIGAYAPVVDENTKKIYICPFTGKVFADNTHPNPQDAIYDWVSKCPENTERVGGLRAKRFFISEDPALIHNYMAKEKPSLPQSKVVYSSLHSSKLFGTKEGVVEEFKVQGMKPLSLVEVQSQNAYKIDGNLLEFIERELSEDKIRQFVEALAEYEEFSPIIQKWLA